MTRGQAIDPTAPEVLTARELALLTAYSHGVQVCDLPGGKESVKTHLTNARRKMGLAPGSRTGHAACEAMRRGLIR